MVNVRHPPYTFFPHYDVKCQLCTDIKSLFESTESTNISHFNQQTMSAYKMPRKGTGMFAMSSTGSVGKATHFKKLGCTKHHPKRYVGLLCLLVAYSVLLVAIYFTAMQSLPRSAKTTPMTSRDAHVRTEANRSWDVTSALKSTYRLVGGALSVGDTAHVIIQAKDASGRNKASGGDFWLALLTSADGTYPTSGGRTAGSVMDHKNGTYSVYFYAAWEGTAYVHITLLLSSNATQWMREFYWPVEKRIFWTGMFLGQYYLGEAVCYLLRNATTSPDLCVINKNPKAMGLTAFYCEKPKSSSCGDFKTAAVNGDMVNRRTSELLQENSTLFKGGNYSQPVSHGPKKIHITQPTNTSPMQTQAPVCRPDADHLVNDGFWLNETWHHLQCKVRRWDDAKAVKNCLRHKHVIIHGDSNVRCWYCVLAKKMGYPWTHLGTGTNRMVMYHNYADSDIETSYNFHPWVVTTAKVSSSETPYEVDVLDSIPTRACSRFIIVLCPWGHFTQWTRSSYIERTLLLRDAVVRLRERCPDVPIVIKGSHPREHLNTLHTVFSSDYTLWAWGRILRDAFRGTGVLFYNVWQMNLSYGKPDIHMPLDVIEEEVNWFLSNVCD